MEVQVISPTIQKFNGESFYLCGQYFQHKGKRLHRTVWEYHHGEIPNGYHIHHIDGNRSNNGIDNLALIVAESHLREHMKNQDRRDICKECIKKAIAAAPAWHKSEDGKAWHSKRGKENWKVRTTQTYSCTYCGKVFQTKHIYGKNDNHFCHPNCKAAFRRQRIRNGEIAK